MKHNESDLQSSCVRWFRYQYRQYEKLLFAVPNGAHRNKITASILKREGVTAGVSDLILLVPNSHHSSLCIEMKTDKGRQTENQSDFQKAAEAAGNKYTIIRSFDDFRNEINTYLNGV
jgi:hypothetical protein